MFIPVPKKVFIQDLTGKEGGQTKYDSVFAKKKGLIIFLFLISITEQFNK
jgi:hypothetical protein